VMTSVIITARSLLQTPISSIGSQFMAFICKGRSSSWSPPTRTVTPGHRFQRRWSRRENQGLEVMNLQPMSYPTMRLLIFFQRFRCVLDWFRNVGSCGMSNVLGLVVGFGISTSLWLRRSRDAIGEEEK
jgi:hypothetical protein